MKFFAALAAIVAVAAAYPASWTLEEIDAALMDPNTDPAIMQYLIAAFNQIMATQHAGLEIESIFIPIPVDVAPVPSPEPAESKPVVASPLVQVIVNVNKEQMINAPEINPSPVDIIENPQAIDTNPALVPQEPSLPVPPYNPIDVIAVNPVAIDSQTNENDILV